MLPGAVPSASTSSLFFANGGEGGGSQIALAGPPAGPLRRPPDGALKQCNCELQVTVTEAVAESVDACVNISVTT